MLSRLVYHIRTTFNQSLALSKAHFSSFPARRPRSRARAEGYNFNVHPPPSGWLVYKPHKNHPCMSCAFHRWTQVPATPWTRYRTLLGEGGRVIKAVILRARPVIYSWSSPVRPLPFPSLDIFKRAKSNLRPREPERGGRKAAIPEPRCEWLSYTKHVA